MRRTDAAYPEAPAIIGLIEAAIRAQCSTSCLGARQRACAEVTFDQRTVVNRDRDVSSSVHTQKRNMQ